LSKVIYENHGTNTDLPTTVDLLGYRQMVRPIVNRILASTTATTPLNVDVYGEWGSGKTSFLKMIDEELRDGGLTPIWFSAWKYDREDNLWSALSRRWSWCRME
jgi:predicted KAP-like P-loop ATPase